MRFWSSSVCVLLLTAPHVFMLMSWKLSGLKMCHYLCLTTGQCEEVCFHEHLLLCVLINRGKKERQPCRGHLIKIDDLVPIISREVCLGGKNNDPISRFTLCRTKCDTGSRSILTRSRRYVCVPNRNAEEDNCPEPNKIDNGFVIRQTLRRVEYRCNKNYFLLGPSRLRCENNKWIGPLGTCHRNVWDKRSLMLHALPKSVTYDFKADPPKAWLNVSYDISNRTKININLNLVGESERINNFVIQVHKDGPDVLHVAVRFVNSKNKGCRDCCTSSPYPGRAYKPMDVSVRFRALDVYISLQKHFLVRCTSTDLQNHVKYIVVSGDVQVWKVSLDGTV